MYRFPLKVKFKDGGSVLEEKLVINMTVLTLKEPITTAADDIFIYLFFLETTSLYITCQADNSHEISSTIFQKKKEKKKKKKKKKKKNRMSSVQILLAL